jgi:hypothetical protein
MKTIRLRLLMLCAILPSAIALAGSYTSFTGTLSFIGTDFNGAGCIFGINGVTGPCPFGQFSMAATAPGYKDQVATLMLAWSSGQTVSVTEDSTDSCINNRANIVGVQINSGSS